MSGGHFSNNYWILENLAEELNEDINRIIEARKKEDEHDWYYFSEETLAKIIQTKETLEKVSKMFKRVDWLLSGDDGEDSFHRRWKEENLN
jgi:hypothetical protein